jgi:hypothetical protein
MTCSSSVSYLENVDKEKGKVKEYENKDRFR